ncbi:MAG TPA: hypothetical protein VFH27_12275 [Longimicrobiaceae bacterium]|nr:hypothetical protein [Longimicrobiaceae bacterium]
MKSFSPGLALGLGLLLGVFRIAANVGDYVGLVPGARAVVSIAGTAGTAGVAVWIGYLLAARSDWRRAVFLHGAAVQAIATMLRIGSRFAIDAHGYRGPVTWVIAGVVAVLSGLAFGAVLVGFAWALRRFELLRTEPEARRPVR